MNENKKKKKITRNKFTTEEDQRIIELQKQFGEDWNMIQSHFGTTRTKRQLRERWNSYLNPHYTIKFTKNEDLYLLKLYSIYGPRWSLIAKSMGNKSSICCRNRFKAIGSKLLFNNFFESSENKGKKKKNEMNKHNGQISSQKNDEKKNYSLDNINNFHQEWTDCEDDEDEIDYNQNYISDNFFSIL